ncbi:MAG: DUF177 domain-containing protein [candidate division WOR-3 bacterium]
MRRPCRVAIASLKQGDNLIEAESEPEELGFERHEVAENPLFDCLVGPLYTSLTITRSGEKFLVRGRVRFRSRLHCAVCGEEFERDYDEELSAEFVNAERPFSGPVHELEPDELDRVAVDGDFLDLRSVVHDAVHLAIPIAPRCRADCRGVCAQCGANLNLGPCQCSRLRAD